MPTAGGQLPYKGLCPLRTVHLSSHYELQVNNSACCYLIIYLKLRDYFNSFAILQPSLGGFLQLSPTLNHQEKWIMLCCDDYSYSV